MSLDEVAARKYSREYKNGGGMIMTRARRLLLFVLLFTAFLAAVPKRSNAWVSTCDSSDPCYTYCTVTDDSGTIVIRRYIINRCS